MLTLVLPLEPVLVLVLRISLVASRVDMDPVDMRFFFLFNRSSSNKSMVTFSLAGVLLLGFANKFWDMVSKVFALVGWTDVVVLVDGTFPRGMKSPSKFPFFILLKKLNFSDFRLTPATPLLFRAEFPSLTNVLDVVLCFFNGWKAVCEVHTEHFVACNIQ